MTNLPANLPALDTAGAAFFRDHAGTSYDPKTETPEEGAARTGRKLARAEAWLKADDDLRIDWADDWEADHVGETYAVPGTCESATLTNGNVDVLASLGCINDATPEYRRVVEAELALEAMPTELVCGCETPRVVTCGWCASSWCERCHPAPSARCHFEYDHADEPTDDDETTPDPDAVTDAERIAYALRKLGGWLENFDTNAATSRREGRDITARAIEARAGDTRDVVAMLDGTDDSYIVALRKVAGQ